MAASVSAEKVTSTWGGDTQMLYDNGFMHMLMKDPKGGVRLFNMDLVENDSPGAGTSEKGESRDSVWGKNQARKILFLDDPRAEKAFLVLFFAGLGKYPLQFMVNGKPGKMEPWDTKKSHWPYRWVEFPADWLKKGKNVIDLSCPEAKKEGEGWGFYLARADEFEQGGGDPKDVGKTSFKSSDGGETWKESPFGPLGQTRTEYGIRISLDRFVKTGWLASPVIDLWKGDSGDFITPVRVFKKLKVSFRSDVPEGTTVEYYLRHGTAPGPFSPEWSAYELIGSGASIDVTLEDRVMNGRYVQLRAVLSTTNPLKSPVVKSANVTTDLLQGFPDHESLKVAAADNPVIKYSSADWEWEAWDRPEFQEVKKRENLDQVIAGSRTEFEKMIKLLEYATTRVPRQYSTPIPEYPGWDALSILQRIDKFGNLGMCIQFNNLLNGLCMAYGMQARLINCINHEVAEVWSDDFGKWVYCEASYANHYLFDIKTGKPLSFLEIHNAYLDYFFKDHPIDWMNESTNSAEMENATKIRKDKPSLMRSSTTYHQNDDLDYKGLVHSAFMRMVPRNNWYGKPYPRPLAHGNSHWPWNGYIEWYDPRTPPHRQYTWHTDRPRDMWPDLNLVQVHASVAHDNKFLYLQFETYTPNFSHFEIDENDSGWKRVDSDRWTWVLTSGKNTLRIRAANKLGAKGKLSYFEVYRADVPLKDLF